MEDVAKIFLMNFEKDRASRLAAFLSCEHHESFRCAREQSFPSAIRQHRCVPDLVIIDVSRDTKYANAILAEILMYRAGRGPKPMTLCISSVYRGPRFELDLERKGARLVYV